MTAGVSDDLRAAIAVTRFGLGARPGELAAARPDPVAWLEGQIRPGGADQPAGALPDSRDRLMALLAYRDEVKDVKAEAKAAPSAEPSEPQAMSDSERRAKSPLQRERKVALRPLLDGVADEILARTVLAAETATPFRERWTLFWANHFTVSAVKVQSAVLVGPFEREAIRPHVFGRFEDLLVASSSHPGMLEYLDQARSAGPNSLAGQRRQMGLNENLAREIMELHSVGADAGYSQADVTEFARALTGWSIGGEREPAERQGRFLFRPQLHEPGARTVMGRTYPAGGEDEARRILADLAAHPATADHIARKLAVHFVADEPPPSLVVRLRTSFLDSRGDLAELARSLVTAPEAWEPAARKFKTPNEFLVSSYRAVGAVPAAAPHDVLQPLTALGQRPFSAPQPNGWSEQASDWAAPDAVVKRLTWAAGFADAHAPAEPVTLAQAALGVRLTSAVATAITRAESRSEALTLMLMSPEFQRR
ncbi:DUF1800 domain-containing protein [Phenylobacterium montanum]|uniref:DUF1800 family protein n=1 Tax=Phenylobacterium montanum TaxID=2823693 RepID=A0A975G2S7_9CAUL|nr:DUF1800 family protein [Caulobacter sp. S6]QUD90080.1 DUF1800 family protein [Caulobacter sp. S6]